MPDTVCKHCGCSEIDEDATRGDKVCTNCGSVLEEQLIVSEIQFQESAAGGASVMGQFVPIEGTKSYSLGGTFTHGLDDRDSRTLTLQNAKRKIQQVASQLRLNARNVDEAYNYFKMALNKNLTRGRRTEHVVAACLYIVCRKNGTSHMLLDLSDVLQVNVYTLGRTFLLVCKELYLTIPVVDPSLYIDRFAGRLQFGDKMKDVISTALRLVQRMKRDWIHTGRRPAGLCGAALLVASRMHDFNRTVKEVIKVVKVCESTVRKRLSEFEDTPSSQLTIEEFYNIDLEEDQDPPCFIEGKKRSKFVQIEERDPQLPKRLEEIEFIQKEIEKSLLPKKPTGIWAAYAKMTTDDTSSKQNDVAEVTNFIEQETLGNVLADSEKESETPTAEEGEASREGESSSVAGGGEEEVTADQPDRAVYVASLAPTAASLGIKSMVEECVQVTEDKDDNREDDDGELDLEGIDDKELDALLLSEEEVKVKTEMWMTEHADYLKAQKEKEERRLKEEQEHGPKQEKKKKRSRKRDKNQPEATSAAEAVARVIQQKKLSNKINYQVLDDLRDMKHLFSGRKGDDTSVSGSEATASQSILKGESSVNRFRRPSLLSDIEAELPAAKKRKKVQIQEPVVLVQEPPVTVEVTGPDVLVESGPVQYDEPEVEGEDYDEEEEEEAHISAQQLFGREVSMEDDDAYYDLL